MHIIEKIEKVRLKTIVEIFWAHLPQHQKLEHKQNTLNMKILKWECGCGFTILFLLLFIRTNFFGVESMLQLKLFLI